MSVFLGIEPQLQGFESEWGETAVSADDVSVLLWQLYDGRLLDKDDTSLALELLAVVDMDQRRGITAGLDEDQTQVGWYPADDETGGRMNNAGIIQPRGSAPYVLVILAYSQPTYEYGRETVETIATLLNAMLADPNSR